MYKLYNTYQRLFPGTLFTFNGRIWKLEAIYETKIECSCDGFKRLFYPSVFKCRIH